MMLKMKTFYNLHICYKVSRVLACCGMNQENTKNKILDVSTQILPLVPRGTSTFTSLCES